MEKREMGGIERKKEARTWATIPAIAPLSSSPSLLLSPSLSLSLLSRPLRPIPIVASIALRPRHRVCCVLVFPIVASCPHLPHCCVHCCVAVLVFLSYPSSSPHRICVRRPVVSFPRRSVIRFFCRVAQLPGIV